LGRSIPSASRPALVEALISDLPSARKDPTAVRGAHRASPRWEQEFETVISWFEAGELWKIFFDR